MHGASRGGDLRPLPGEHERCPRPPLDPRRRVPGRRHAGGIADLAGNTFEWTSSLAGDATGDESALDYPYPSDATDGRENAAAPPGIGRITRGGSMSYSASEAHAVSRDCALPTSAEYEGSLRLVVPSG